MHHLLLHGNLYMFFDFCKILWLAEKKSYNFDPGCGSLLATLLIEIKYNATNAFVEQTMEGTLFIRLSVTTYCIDISCKVYGQEINFL